MKNLIIVCLLSIAGFFIFSGCGSSGMFVASNQTKVELSQPNFKIVAVDVAGEAEAGYVFGASYSMGSITQTMAVARVSGTGFLYQEALEKLWQNYEKTNGPVTGKKLALINVRYDSDLLNVLVYTQVKIYIRADVIEFVE